MTSETNPYLIADLQQGIQFRKQRIITEVTDRRQACEPDVQRPFTSLRDMWERLHVYHVFDTQFPTQDKSEQFKTELAKHVTLLADRITDCENKFLQLSADMEGGASTSEDKLYLARLASVEQDRRTDAVRAERARVLKMPTLLLSIHGAHQPAPAPAPAAAASAPQSYQRGYPTQQQPQTQYPAQNIFGGHHQPQLQHHQHQHPHPHHAYQHPGLPMGLQSSGGAGGLTGGYSLLPLALQQQQQHPQHLAPPRQ